MEWLTTWSVWHWLILGFLLLIGEILISGVFLLWWGLAAILVALLNFAIPSLNLTALLIIFAVTALILSLFWWKYQHGKDQKDQQISTLNQRDHAMIGTQGVVQEIAENGIGRGAFGDTTWRIQGVNLNVGDVIMVERVEGITLFVNKV